MNYCHTDRGLLTADPAEAPVFALLSVARRLQERLEHALDAIGLSSAKFMALDALVRAGKPLTLGDLAGELQCVRSNITQLVDRLEADGLVQRVNDPTDRRTVRAVITSLGTSRQAAGADAIASLQRDLAGRVEPADRAQFFRVLAALA
jgi:DNA-binding MarR family transcriptional regulator